jgi:acetyltransferase-like isoleucine patch superfamily enzyme
MTNKQNIIPTYPFGKVFLFILGLPKTIYFNFKYFPFLDAIKLPVFVSSRVWLMQMGGKVNLGVVKTGIVKIGFGDVGIFDRQKSRSIWQVSGLVQFIGSAKVGHGSKISVLGELVVGNNFCISAESALIAHNKITIGDDVLISWDVLIMDTDGHNIFNDIGLQINKPKEVIIGDKVWVGCRSLILKGVRIADGVVVAADSTLTKSVDCGYSIVGGSPVRQIKRDVKWMP